MGGSRSTRTTGALCSRTGGDFTTRDDKQQAKAGTVELMGGVNSRAPQAEPTLFSLDEGEAKGWVVTSDEASHPGKNVAIERIAPP